MEAESKRDHFAIRVVVCLAVCVFSVGLAAGTADAANFRTQNFIIQAPDAQLARAVGEAAEKYRRDLATYWLGRPLPPWPTPCPVRVVAGNLAAQGVTTYQRSPVRDFQMEVIGTPERILDSVLPHEVTHTVLATHFGRPLPRWADEGICTTVEHESERNKHEAKLREFLATRRGIAMNQLFLLTEYPSDVLPMYAQGYSVCRFLIEQKDAPAFIAFLTDYMRYPSWTENVKKHYGYESLAELQQYWLAWVSEGSGPVDAYVKSDPTRPDPSRPAPTAVAANFNVPSATVAPPAADGPAMSLIAPVSNPSPAAALTNATGGTNPADGWYQRKRAEATQSNPALAAAPTKSNPIAPPSVIHSGRYKSAQPQPETRLPGGTFQNNSDWQNNPDGSPRYR